VGNCVKGVDILSLVEGRLFSNRKSLGRS